MRFRLPIRILSLALATTLLAAAPATARDKRTATARAADMQCANQDLQPTQANLEAVRAAVLCLHNRVRAQHNLPLLRQNRKLELAARGHSSDMVARGYFDHTAPGGSTMVDRILGARYARKDEGWALGENLAWGTGSLGTPAGVMRAWMSSAGHRANILRRSYREVGLGVVVGVPGGGSGATYTADFGAR